MVFIPESGRIYLFLALHHTILALVNLGYFVMETPILAPMVRIAKSSCGRNRTQQQESYNIYGVMWRILSHPLLLRRICDVE